MEYFYHAFAVVLLALLALITWLLLQCGYSTAKTAGWKLFWTFWTFALVVTYIAFHTKLDTMFRYEQFKRLDRESEVTPVQPARSPQAKNYIEPSAPAGTKVTFEDFITRPVVE